MNEPSERAVRDAASILVQCAGYSLDDLPRDGKSILYLADMIFRPPESDTPIIVEDRP